MSTPLIAIKGVFCFGEFYHLLKQTVKKNGSFAILIDVGIVSQIRGRAISFALPFVVVL